METQSFNLKPIKEDIFSVLSSWCENGNDNVIIDEIVRTLRNLNRYDIVYIVGKLLFLFLLEYVRFRVSELFH